MCAKKWINSEISHFLCTVDSLLPTGRWQWERVSISCHKNNKKWIKNSKNCKNKFEKLAFMKKLTGTVEILLSALRAKVEKEKMSSNEMIGFCEENY